MRIALASLDQAWEDRDENLRRCARLVAEATSLGAELIVFPELTPTGFTMNAAAIAEPANASPSVQSFRQIAREHRVHIAFGVALTGEQLPRNVMVLAGPDGAEVARYAKLHPFTHAGEHEHFEPGSEVVVASAAGTRLGLTICYDLRFPELYSALAPHCDAIMVIANWPAPRIEHWHALIRARAIDSQCWVLAVNRTGTDANGLEYPRSSAVVSPRGDVLEPDVSSGELDVYTVDAAAAVQYRRSFPTLRDRRNDLYARLLSSS